MNKKVAVFLAVAMALLSIVIVSTFGLIPEDLRENIAMSNLYFDVQPILDNSTNEYNKYITMNFKANNNTINLYEKVKYEPLNSTNVTMQYTCDQPTNKVAISSTGFVTIYDLTLTSFVIVVKSTDGSNLTDRIIVRKPSSDDTRFDDDWQWG